MTSTAMIGTAINYDARLSADNEIRLIELQPWTAEGSVICNMIRTTIDAARETGYEALSYTWGSADSPRATISIDGRMCEVRENLRNAMHQLSKREGVCRIWIDALCINQNDVDERNSQVRRMARIYKEAESLDIWLGLESPEDIDAVRYIAELDSSNADPFSDEQKWFGRHLDKLDSIAALCHRPYWTRLWIIQELLLSSKVRAYYGGLLVKLPYLEAIVILLTIMRDHDEGRHRELLNKVVKSPYGNFNAAACQLSITNNSSWLKGQTHPLPHVMIAFQSSHCFDIRDQIFGLHSLSDACCAAAVPVDYSKPVPDLCVLLLEHHIVKHGAGKDHNYRFLYDFFRTSTTLQYRLLHHQTLDDELRTAKLTADALSRIPTPFGLPAFIHATVSWVSPELHSLPANYLEDAFADTEEQTLFMAMAREVTELWEQMKRERDWLDRICRFDSIKTVKWPVSTNASLYLLPKPLMSPVDGFSVPTVRETLRRIVRFAQYITRSFLSTQKSYRLILTNDGDFLLGPNTVSERDVLCFVSLYDSGPVVVARVQSLHALETIGVAIPMMKRDGLISGFYSGCKVAFELGFDVLVDITGSERRQQRGMLAEASFEGHREMVQLLLDKGVSVNLLHPYFGSALQAASAGGHEDIVNALLVKGAKVDAQDGKWRNALGAAAFHGKVSVARLLLEHGASINVHGGEHSIALAFSLVAGHFDIASLLLDKGARFCKIGGATFEVCETTASEQGKAAVRNEDADGGGERHNNLILRHPDGHEILLSKLCEVFAEFESRWGESSDEWIDCTQLV
jgi:hypothetical protein